VATFFGAVLVLQPWLGLIACAAWLLVAGLFRYSSLASLSAAVIATLAAALLYGFDVTLLVLCAMTLLLVLRHRTNIENLLAGKERRIGAKAAQDSKPPRL
jgi:glycerol-3-phosphate acyltransferase PlsY